MPSMSLNVGVWMMLVTTHICPSAKKEYLIHESNEEKILYTLGYLLLAINTLPFSYPTFLMFFMQTDPSLYHLLCRYMTNFDAISL